MLRFSTRTIAFLIMALAASAAPAGRDCRACRSEAFRQVQATDRLRYNDLCGPDQPSKARACKDYMRRKISDLCGNDCGQ